MPPIRVFAFRHDDHIQPDLKRLRLLNRLGCGIQTSGQFLWYRTITRNRPLPSLGQRQITAQSCRSLKSSSAGKLTIKSVSTFAAIKLRCRAGLRLGAVTASVSSRRRTSKDGSSRGPTRPVPHGEVRRVSSARESFKPHRGQVGHRQ